MGTVFSKTELVRRSISLPQELAGRIDEIAATRRVSANRAMIDLFLRDAIAAYEERRRGISRVSGRFQKSTDPSERKSSARELCPR